jgi:hypothetical protein
LCREPIDAAAAGEFAAAWPLIIYERLCLWVPGTRPGMTIIENGGALIEASA